MERHSPCSTWVFINKTKKNFKCRINTRPQRWSIFRAMEWLIFFFANFQWFLRRPSPLIVFWQSDHCHQWFFNGFWCCYHRFQWFSMVPDHWSNDAMVSMDRCCLINTVLKPSSISLQISPAKRMKSVQFHQSTSWVRSAWSSCLSWSRMMKNDWLGSTIRSRLQCQAFATQWRDLVVGYQQGRDVKKTATCVSEPWSLRFFWEFPKSIPVLYSTL